MKLKSAGIHIPTYNQVILDEGQRVQFEIDKSDISSFKFLFARTASFQPSGAAIDDRLCPFIDIADEYVRRENLGGGRIRITMDVNPVIVDAVVEHGCVVTTRPDP